MPVPSEAMEPPHPTPIPYLRVVILGLILAANNTSIWMIFSFLPFMVHHFFPDLPMAQLGYEAGMLGSAFSAGSLIGNIVWGIVSDRAGRRPTLLCGLLGTAISALAFGFAPSFYVAVFARFLWGLLNGNLGVSKTYLTEISDDSNAARGMAIFGAIGGIGRTIGPVIGGFLSSPAEKYPHIFTHTIFETYPYSLACLVVAVNCLIVFVLAYCFIGETLPSAMTSSVTGSSATTTSSTGPNYALLRTYEDLDHSNSPSSTSPLHTPPSPSSSSSSTQIMIELPTIVNSRRSLSDRKGSIDGVVEEESKGSSSCTQSLLEKSGSIPSSSSATTSPQNSGKEQQKKKVMFSGIVEVSVIGSNTRAYSGLKNVSPYEEPTLSPLPPDASTATVALSPDSLENGGRPYVHRLVQYSTGSEEMLHNTNPSILATIRSILHQQEVVLSTSLYGLTALAVMIYNEVFPLWVVLTPKQGGFQLDSDGIGIIIMICGVLSILLQATIYPALAEALGVVNMFKLSAIFMIIVAIITPAISLFNVWHTSWVIWVALCFIQLSQTVASNWAYISIFVLINNSSYRQQRATVNGLGQTFASLGRLCGPFLGATLFAWSESNGLYWPLNFYLVFYAVAFVCFVDLYVGYQLPYTIERRKREPRINLVSDS